MQVTLDAFSEEGAFIMFIGIDKRKLSTNTFREYLGGSCPISELRQSRKVLATGLCWYCTVFLVRSLVKVEVNSQIHPQSLTNSSDGMRSHTKVRTNGLSSKVSPPDPQ